MGYGNHRSGKSWSVLAALALSLWTAGPVAAASSDPDAHESLSEYEVKAAFLFNFAKFVKWPERSAPSITVCVLAEDAVERTIEKTIGGKTLRDKPVVVKRPADLEDHDCQILFISDSRRTELARILRSMNGASVLTVGETDAFAERGGIINFRTENDRVRFEINPEAAQNAGLEISSQLLKLATIVHDRTKGR